ncbi:MAG: hypothetical protein DHS20C14_20900 [Phycisphaeraceae bacterium]|nr:MAG: hypothetical protein DHS20C14_20900 [Phycisphaeraceae bacterium]
MLAPSVRAQQDATESFLLDHGLDRLAETYLTDRAQRALGDDRDRLLARLGNYYAQRLADENDPTERARLMEAASELLAGSDASEVMGLRLAVAIARYRPAEETAELHRLLLADDTQAAEALASISEIATEFSRVGEQLERDVLYQERRQRTAAVRDPGASLPELADARRNRSLAKYYAGWSRVYESTLTDREGPARAALEHFAWVLDTPGEDPSLDRLPRSLIGYEHVARAAVGVAVAHSRLGNHDTALAWLDAVAEETTDKEALQAQVFTRRVAALARAGRWKDLDLRVTQRRASPDTPLSVPEARLVAVLALRARSDNTLAPADHDTVERLSEAALGDLVRQEELPHVLDLAAKFGDLPLDGSGFVVRYVRGSELYDKARAAHRDREPDANLPATANSVQGLYRTAGARLFEAVNSEQSKAFTNERANAAYDAALCAYYAAEFRTAVERFVFAESVATNPAERERSLWMAIVCTERRIKNGDATDADRYALAERYLLEHPEGARAPALLLRTLSADLLPEPDAIEILRRVPTGDPLEGAAKRELARLLYRRVRKANGSDRVMAANEFLAVATEIVMGSAADPAERSTLITLARQVLDVALLMDPPNIEVARNTFDLLDVTVGTPSDRDLADELLLRRVQLLLAESRETQASALLATFNDGSGPFAQAARRVLFARALGAWRSNPTRAHARDIVSSGTWLLDRPDPDPAIAEAVADAAAWLWDQHADTESRDLAITIDRREADAERYTIKSLRRLARLSEIAALPDQSERAWALIMSAYRPGDEVWFEARYQSLRLLAAREPQRAREAFDQLAALYPSLGPEPWRTRLTELAATLPARAQPAPAEGDAP